MNFQANEDRVAALIQKLRMNEITSEESAELEQCIAVVPGLKEYLEKLQDEEFVGKKIRIKSSIDTKAEFARFKELAGFAEERRSRYRIMIRRFAAAAVFLLIIVSSVYLYSHFNQQAAPVQSAEVKKMADDILPAAGQVVLTLADGKTVNLDSRKAGELVATEGGSSVTSNSDELIYASNKAGGDEEVRMNKVATGTAGMYKLTLEDGTRVWLNSKSSLKYPASFGSGDRRVTLEGQGYFDVAKDSKRPFFVTINSTEIQVLGTRFDINGYAGRSINTTLFNGSVVVSHNGESEKLKPGQQAIVTEKGAMKIEQTPDEDHVMAWINGNFSFHSATIEEILEELGRNYDISDIVYEAKPSGKFHGVISKKVPLSEVLRIFSATDYVHFKIVDGNKIIVKP